MISQLSSIAFVKTWGIYSDRYSNKTIIRICAPLYIACMFAWAFVPSSATDAFTLPMLVTIHVVMGLSTAGINLSISNIALKLAPAEDAIAFIVARNMVVAFIPALAPVAGGFVADFFRLQHWDVFFVIGALLAFCSLRFLKNVSEEGEVEREVLIVNMFTNMKG